MSLYEQPLDPSRSETRLLTLLPSPNFDAEIQCLLDVVSLDETTDFEALSYVWGDPTIREPISVGGDNVLVTTNLIAALRRLRKPESRRVLWVDAVCIDQGHTAEKNAQLPLMARIYRSARSVVAWLGEPTEEMEAAILWAQEYFNETTIPGPSSSATSEPPSSSNLSRSYVPGEDSGEEGKTPDVSSITKLGQVMLGVEQFHELTYWNRMWTLQEYRLPKTEPISICGSYSFFTTQLLEPAIFPLMWEFIDQAEKAMGDSQELPLYDRPDRGTVPCRRPNPKLATNREGIEQGSLSPNKLWRVCMDRKFKVLGEAFFVSADIIKIRMESRMRKVRERSSEVRALGSNLGSPMPEFESAVQQQRKALQIAIEHASRASTICFSLRELRKPLEGSPWPMSELLTDSRNRQCHDVKDKVYALYSMLPEVLQLLYPPDYHKHPGQVFQETAAYILQYEYSRACWIFHEFGFQGLEESPDMTPCPSWVPDFGLKDRKEAQYYQMELVQGRLIEWASDRLPRISNGLQTLETQALLLGNVVMLLEFGETMEAIAAQIASLLEKGKNLNVPLGASSERAAQQVAGTLVRLCTEDNRVHPKFFLKQGFGLDYLLAGGKLMVTERGNLGFCSSSTRNGDLAAFLPFMAQTVVLREWKTSSSGVVETHKMVGHAIFPELNEVDESRDNGVVDDILAQEPVQLSIQ
ncbi:hypothetical protein PG990_015335 [Apiospora arundinis]